MIPGSLYINVYEVMIKSITNILMIFFIFQQLKSQSKIDQMDTTRFAMQLLFIY